MQQKLIQFQQSVRNPNLVVPKFVMYNLTNNGVEVVWINVKYDVDLEFSCKEMKEFLMNLLGVDEAKYATLIKNQMNQRNQMVKYHGTIQDPDVINFITKRKQENSKFTDNDGVDYTLMEIGVNINDNLNIYRPPGTPIQYEKKNRMLEIKFFKSGDPSTRVVVNVHFIHNDQKNDIKAAICELNDLISKINYEEVKNQITIASKVSIFNFAEQEYLIAQASLPYYDEIIRYHDNSGSDGTHINETQLNDSESLGDWGEMVDKKDDHSFRSPLNNLVTQNKHQTISSIEERNEVSHTEKCYWCLDTKNKKLSFKNFSIAELNHYVINIKDKYPKNSSELFDSTDNANKSLDYKSQNSKNFIFELDGSKEMYLDLFANNPKEIAEKIISIHMYKKVNETSSLEIEYENQQAKSEKMTIFSNS